MTKTESNIKIELKRGSLEPKWHWSVRYCCNFLCAKHGYKQKILAKFLRSFSKFSQVFRGFRELFEAFGSIRTHWDAFGCIRKQLEAFGRFRIF